MIQIALHEESFKEKRFQWHRLPRRAPAFRLFTRRSGGMGRAAIFLLMAAVYYQVLGKLVRIGTSTRFFTRFLVPIFAAFLIWEKRKTLLSVELLRYGAGLP